MGEQQQALVRSPSFGRQWRGQAPPPRPACATPHPHPTPHACMPCARTAPRCQLKAARSLPPTLQIFVCSIFLALFVAYGIGANDVSAETSAR